MNLESESGRVYGRVYGRVPVPYGYCTVQGIEAGLFVWAVGVLVRTGNGKELLAVLCVVFFS